MLLMHDNALLDLYYTVNNMIYPIDNCHIVILVRYIAHKFNEILRVYNDLLYFYFIMAF